MFSGLSEATSWSAQVVWSAHECACTHIGMESVSRNVWKYCSKLGGGHVGKSEGLSGRDAYGW